MIGLWMEEKKEKNSFMWECHGRQNEWWTHMHNKEGSNSVLVDERCHCDIEHGFVSTDKSQHRLSSHLPGSQVSNSTAGSVDKMKTSHSAVQSQQSWEINKQEGKESFILNKYLLDLWRRERSLLSSEMEFLSFLSCFLSSKRLRQSRAKWKRHPMNYGIVFVGKNEENPNICHHKFCVFYFRD